MGKHDVPACWFCAIRHLRSREEAPLACILPHAVLDGPPLLWIERLKVSGGLRHAQIVLSIEKITITDSWFVRNDSAVVGQFE
jgi:hypothetical protein